MWRGNVVLRVDGERGVERERVDEGGEGTW